MTSPAGGSREVGRRGGGCGHDLELLRLVDRESWCSTAGVDIQGWCAELSVALIFNVVLALRRVIDESGLGRGVMPAWVCYRRPGRLLCTMARVTSTDLDEWKHDFDAVMRRMRSLFYRTESKKHAEQYVRGLLSPLARKNGWTIAEYVCEPEPKALQRLLNLSPWDADALQALNREYAMENLADPGGILVADPTGFAKKGSKSVGVQWQYSGSAVRTEWPSRTSSPPIRRPPRTVSCSGSTSSGRNA
jgi:hypothetical protein